MQNVINILKCRDNIDYQSYNHIFNEMITDNNINSTNIGKFVGIQLQELITTFDILHIFSEMLEHYKYNISCTEFYNMFNYCAKQYNIDDPLTYIIDGYKNESMISLLSLHNKKIPTEILNKLARITHTRMYLIYETSYMNPNPLNKEKYNILFIKYLNEYANFCNCYYGIINDWKKMQCVIVNRNIFDKKIKNFNQLIDAIINNLCSNKEKAYELIDILMEYLNQKN